MLCFEKKTDGQQPAYTIHSHWARPRHVDVDMQIPFPKRLTMILHIMY